MTNFLDSRKLLADGPRGLTHALERALWHLGFVDVRVVDGRDDGGADLLAVRNGQQWVVQSKWTSRGTIDRVGIDDCERAKTRYEADKCVLATNGALSRGAESRRKILDDVGIKIDVWNGKTLASIGERMSTDVPSRLRPRKYQKRAITRLREDLAQRQRALLVLATGLGKTMVGGEVIRQHLDEHPHDRILVVAHMRELVEQLERSLWRHLPKTVSTQVLTSERKPTAFDGVTCATIDSALGLVADGYKPNLIMIDETHHVGAAGMYQMLLEACAGALQFGVTATPWRGDKFDIEDHFGAASFTMGIEEGMREGHLVKVDYRLFVDDLDWDFVAAASRQGHTIRELNSKLFLPQRDEVVIDYLREAWRGIHEPRGIVFCQTIEHAERMAELLASSDPAWARAAALHSGVPKQHRQILLNSFRLGRVPILTTVDVFNEGVDVPDVNIIAFLRVTHSRRIFVQQLGRGLRLRDGKESLLALDFVSDIRRVAAALRLRRSLNVGDTETLNLPLARGNKIEFTDASVGSLLDQWIRDAADLETSADEVHLQFPDVSASVN
ncbi:restriction endonuclease subunit R [Saccharopolyspora rhizosphaerae]|uniref:Restriction endonuclease subunit R n=1 Tax=Saccharopolyspora rhizosphaerae TaxID=2492662 RepID=A0A3R8P6X7_9PSEU|nr:DEAD/DEAH box helicase family protein [Saccharopolyspora rhizosphaerae]RRO17650.1 restriction endonuclease subunit R [Saccharopolyspora rhizosphaerae]